MSDAARDANYKGKYRKGPRPRRETLCYDHVRISQRHVRALVSRLTLTLTPNTPVFFDSPMNIDNCLHMLRFNPRHWQIIAVYTFELLILRSQCQPTLEMRARVGLCNLP